MDKYSNIYVGLVINNSDPKKRGRVQVFIPHITNTLYKGWNDTKTDKKFRSLDSFNFSFEIVQKLVDTLPWAEVSMPFFGGGTGAPIKEGVPVPIPTNQNNDVSEIGGYAAVSTTKPIQHPKEDGLNSPRVSNTSSNKVDEQELYNTIHSQLQEKLKGVDLNAAAPFLAQFGVSPTVEGVSLLMMKVANKESSFESTAIGDKGRKGGGIDDAGNKLPDGSYGLFQISSVDVRTYRSLGFKGLGAPVDGDGFYDRNGIPGFSMDQMNNPALNTDFTTSVFAYYLKNKNYDKLKEYGWLQDIDREKLANYNKSFSPGDTVLKDETSYTENNILAMKTNSFQNVRTGTNSTGVAGGPIGISTIPQIGSKAYVMFLDGNPLQPIVVGCYKEPTNT